jgi:heat shock protein HslJ
MRRPFILALITIASLFYTTACQPGGQQAADADSTGKSSTPSTDIKPAAAVEDKPYFKASGTEPFWGLTISSSTIKFTSINEYNDSFMSPHSVPEAGVDNNTKLYKLQTEAGKMEIVITRALCINAMSGDSSPYRVSVVLTQGNNTERKSFEGCGRYVTDSSLNGKWRLEQLENTIIDVNDFNAEIPYLNINTDNNAVSGYAGCNRLNGSIFFEQGVLRFTKVATTRKMCAANNKENLFLKALNASQTYKIENDRLTISHPAGILAIFKKE